MLYEHDILNDDLSNRGNELTRTRQEDVDTRSEIHTFTLMYKQSEEGRFPGRDLDSPSSLKVSQALPIRPETFCHTVDVRNYNQ